MQFKNILDILFIHDGEWPVSCSSIEQEHQINEREEDLIMEKNLLTILSDFTVKEVEFLIHYYEDLDMVNDMEKLIELKELEERIPGITLGNFGDMIESCYKVGQCGPKNKYEKIAQKLSKKYIGERDFFLLTIAICEENPEIASYIKTPYGC